ncbi:MAG: glycosyltransferase, partial [Patescibacteria group bacterium]
IYKNSNFHIVTPSKWLANKVAQSILGNKPLSVIHNGIDTNIFKPLRSDLNLLRSDLGLPTNKRIILVVAKGGASNPWKGGNYAQEAIQAFRGDSRAFFVDLGGDTGQDSPTLKTVGYVADQGTLAKYYSAADILLYPSIADNCPLVVLEAQACGLPVVSFATGGIPELVDHQKTGYIARYKDIADIITGIQWMLSRSPAELATMREAAIAKIHSDFTLEKMTDQYLNLYKKEIENFNLFK